MQDQDWILECANQTSKLAQVTAEMRNYSLHILGISESRWTGTGRHKTNTGETVLYSGRDDNQHHEGVAIILKKQMEKCLMEWRPVNKQTHESQIVGETH